MIELQPAGSLPPWMLAQLDQILAETKCFITDHISAAATDYKNDPTVLLELMTPLTRPPEDEDERERWEYACDNCAQPAEFQMVLLRRFSHEDLNVQLHVVAYICKKCRDQL